MGVTGSTAHRARLPRSAAQGRGREALAAIGRLVAGALTAVLVAACGSETEAPPGAGVQSLSVASRGQVAPPSSTASTVSAYAAARFLEQASWGPTPALVAEVQRLGFEAWIDQQLAERPTLMRAPRYVIDFDTNNRAQSQLAHGWFELRFMDAVLGGPDQLRQRMAWALYNFLVVGQTANPYGITEYFNLLQSRAFGSYADLLVEVTLNPAMGAFLDNKENTAQTPNENYARELMQLFSVGLVLLNPDGTVRRDGSGKPLETYSQDDVVAATRALSGWSHDWEEGLPNSNWGNFGKRMVPRRWPDQSHDTREKRVLGVTIPASQSIERDLQSLIQILVNHPNTAPFVSRRLIQSLVSSDPSPHYLSRVARVFNDSQGDLAQVVKAILLDPEARSGDDFRRANPRVGKIKEPLLHHANLLRALGCTSAIRDRMNPNEAFNSAQMPYRAPSVFGYFSPDHRAPGSRVLAPEQALLTGSAIDMRLGSLSWQIWGPHHENNSRRSQFQDSGCDIELFVRASQRSDDVLLALLSERMFRGMMPQGLRAGAKALLESELTREPADRRFSYVMEFLAATPAYGVIR